MVAPVQNTTRAGLLWVGLGAVVIGAFFVAVAVLNATVYSAPGFVRGYLDALDRGDTASALSLAGVTPGAGEALLTVPERGTITDPRVVTDIQPATPGTVHAVTVSFTAAGRAHTATFTVVRSGVIGGLFTRWRFLTPPTASIDVTPAHDPRFTANGVPILAASADKPSRYRVLAPAVVGFAFDSTYLTAPATTVVAAAPGAAVTTTVGVVPKRSFVDTVTADVAKYLRTTCLPQRVLLPAGCPFGQQVDDRLTSAPLWSMPAYPPVALVPTSTVGVWRVAPAGGQARLRVGAQSLFDGHAYAIDERVPFRVGYLVAIGADDRLTITPN